MTDEINFDGAAFQTPLERAVKTDSGIDNLSKAEAIYYISARLTGEVPEGHPDDHNGNATRERITEWAESLATQAREGDD